MINKNRFNIKKLNNILFFGESPYLQKLIEINKKYGIKSHLLPLKVKVKVFLKT